MTYPLLTLENIHASYYKREVLRGLSLHIGKGEVVALLGENGKGKSTVLRVISGLLKPTSGRIEFQGRGITALSAEQRQQLGIGYLLQGGRVFRNLTVEENYLIALRHRPHNAEHAYEFPGGVFPDLKDLKKKRAGLLSGGQRQMLAVEMASLQCGVIGLWDEPTAGLSEKAAELALSQILRVAGPDRAHLIVEQRRDLVAAIATRVVLIDELFRGCL